MELILLNSVKKSRWNKFYEKAKSIIIPPSVEEIEVNEPERIRANENVVCVPKDLLVDGVYDGKFKRANQRALAEILGITIKQDEKKK